MTAWDISTRSMGLGVLRTKVRLAVISPLDSDPGRLAGGSSSRCFGHCGRCLPFPGIQGPISSSGAPGGGDSSAAVVARAMAIAQLTQLHILVPASGVPPSQVPAECFPGGTSAREPTSPRRVTFASDVTVLGGAPSPIHSPDIIIHEPNCPEVTEEVATDVSAPIVPPPLGFCQFSWPREDWQVGGDSSLFTVDEELPGWPPGVLRDCWLICHYCRCCLSFWTARKTLSLLRLDRPGRSQVLRLRLSWTRHQWGTLRRM